LPTACHLSEAHSLSWWFAATKSFVSRLALAPLITFDLIAMS
jgi:hypothetical protein